jgi:hypothetical protein
MFESDNNEEILDCIKSCEIFSNSKSIEELIFNNIDYLKGNLTSTSYAYGPIETQTYGILEQLININTKGFITVNSCNGRKDPIFCYNRCHTNKYRSYLRGLIKKSDFNKLKSLDSSEFIVTIHNRKNHHLHYSNILNEDLWVQICNCEQIFIKNIEEWGTDSFECFSKCKNIYNKLIEDYCDVSILDTKFGRSCFLFDKIIECLS